RLICDVVYPDASPFEGSPRYVLQRVTQAAAMMGYTFEVSPELEFFLFDAPPDRLSLPPMTSNRGYFNLRLDDGVKARQEIVEVLQMMGIQVEMGHCEVALGQHEIDLAFVDALRAADAVVTARYTIKAIARQHGLWATFMPKPFFGVFGNG